MSLICRILYLPLLLFICAPLLADINKALDAYQKGNYIKAHKAFLKAAKSGHADAQYNLAIMLYTGKGVSRDKSKAVYWFIKAAESGDVSAQYNLGVLYASDKELPKEYPKMDGDDIYFELSTKKPSSNMEKAFKWYKMAAEQGHDSAQLNLGVLYNQGIGVEQDYAQAAHWYTKAAEQDNKKAQLNLGILYDTGRGVEKDLAKAEQYYKQAAKQGMRDAQYNLGIIYYNGEGGIKRNYLESYAWLALAKEQGSELAAIYKDKAEKKLKKPEQDRARKKAVDYYRSYLKPFQNSSR